MTARRALLRAVAGSWPTAACCEQLLAARRRPRAGAAGSALL